MTGSKFPTTPTPSILYTVPMYSIVVSCDVTKVLFVTDAVCLHVVFGVCSDVFHVLCMCVPDHMTRPLLTVESMHAN